MNPMRAGRTGRLVTLLSVLGACLLPGAWPMPARAQADEPFLGRHFMFPGFFARARNASDYFKPVPPTASGRRFQTGDGTSVIILEGVDPPIPYDRDLGFGCVAVHLNIGRDGHLVSYQLLDPVPADGDYKPLEAALAQWRFNTSTIQLRGFMVPLGVLDGNFGNAQKFKEMCHVPEVRYRLTLQPGLSLKRQELLETPRFHINSKQEPLRDLVDYMYPAALLVRGQTGCVSLSFVLDTQGRPADFKLLKAWPADPAVAAVFAHAAAASLHEAPVDGSPSPQRSMASVDYRVFGLKGPPLGACAPAPATSDPTQRGGEATTDYGG